MKETLGVLFAVNELIGWIANGSSVVRWLTGLPYIVIIVAVVFALWLMFRRTTGEKEVDRYMSESYARGQC
jgi:hypothetical protein